MQRRQALSILGAGATAFGAYRSFGNAGMAARDVAWPPGLSPAYTPAELFYTVSKNEFFDRGVSRVEIGLGAPDQPASLVWRDADLAPELGRAAWRQWTCPFIPTPGRHRLVVRATDGAGLVQPEARRGNFPNGAQGWDAVEVSASS